VTGAQAQFLLPLACLGGVLSMATFATELLHFRSVPAGCVMRAVDLQIRRQRHAHQRPGTCWLAWQDCSSTRVVSHRRAVLYGQSGHFGPRRLRL